jgi:hypothetical protein
MLRDDGGTDQEWGTVVTDQPQMTDGCDDPDCEYPHCLCGVPPLKTTKSSQTEPDRWVIELALDDREKAMRAYGTIAQLLFEMGEIETLRFWRRNRVWVTDAARE